MDDEIQESLVGQIPGPPVEEGWYRTPFYCCLCGCRPVDREYGEGDYYVGPDYWCRSCDEKYTMG